LKQNLFFLAVSFFLLSCQKEFTIDTSSTIVDSTGDPKTDTCDTYFPLTTGSTWTYEQPGGIQINTVITPDTVIRGNIFKRVSQVLSGDVTNSFFREENGNVYAYMNLSTNGSANGEVIVNPIRSKVAVGARWSDTIVINNSTERLEYEMMEKNITRGVDTFYFTNVLHVQYTVRIDLPPVITDELVQITDVWYAKCVGVIETKSQLLTQSIIVGSPNRIKSYLIR